MEGDDLLQNRASAVADYNRARRQAALKDMMTRLSGVSSELLSYEDVRRQLKGRESSGRRLEDIPLEAIIGSSARYQEFTRGFLPRKYVRSDRWVGVKMAMTGLKGVPPIEVYRIGEVYFVQDGNHRVSVAREMGLKTIQAYVTEVKTKVSLGRDTRPEDIILAAEYTEFLERTGQKELRPGADLRVTTPCQYPVLLEHIGMHRYFMGLEQQREIAYQDAFCHWYDTIYLPAVEMIRERGLLRDFPERTETDLYLWLCRHRAEMENALGWEISPDVAASDLSSRFVTRQALPNLARIRLQGVLTVAETDIGATQTPLQQLPVCRSDRVVDDLLVVVNGKKAGWRALEQALLIARKEKSRLHGLHIVSTEAEREGEFIESLREDFRQRCRDAGIGGKLAIAVGKKSDNVCERARWADLVVTSIRQPPLQSREKLGAGFRSLLRRCPRPVLAVACAPSPADRVLLAYDGSPKAEEALYISAYLGGWWHAALCVVTVGDNVQGAKKIQAPARTYLEQHRVRADFLQVAGLAEQAILKIADERDSNLIVMGGYSASPPLKLVLGSAVDGVLRASQRPVLICQ